MRTKIVLAAMVALCWGRGLRADTAVSSTAQATAPKKLVPKLPAVFKRGKKIRPSHAASSTHTADVLVPSKN